MVFKILSKFGQYYEDTPYFSYHQNTTRLVLFMRCRVYIDRSDKHPVSNDRNLINSGKKGRYQYFGMSPLSVCHLSPHLTYPVTLGGSLGHQRWLSNKLPLSPSVLSRSLWCCKLQPCPFFYVVFPSLLLSSTLPPHSHCSLQDGLCEAFAPGYVTIPFQFLQLFHNCQ